MTDQFCVLTEVTVTSGYRCDFRQLCGEGRTGACEAEKSAHSLRSGWRYVPVSIFCSLVTQGHGDVSTVLKLDLPELFQNKLFKKKFLLIPQGQERYRRHHVPSSCQGGTVSRRDAASAHDHINIATKRQNRHHWESPEL